MNGDIAEGGPMVPAELTEYTQQGYTSLLIEYLLGENVNEEIILSNLPTQDKDTKLRIRRLYDAGKDIEEFLESIKNKNKLSVEEQREVKEALALMLKLHIDQPDRADGSGPYITHPLKVAMGILETYKGEHLADTVIAALLHDAVEDQAHLAEILHITEEESGSTDAARGFFALRGIEEKFGPDVAELVRMLSNDKDVTRADFSNEDYLEFVKGIVENVENHGPEAFAIKWQDARENMLKVGQLWRYARYLEDEVAKTLSSGSLRERQVLETISKVKDLYFKLINKYEPVLREVFLPAFRDMSSKHVLYRLRQSAIREIEGALAEEYNLDKE